ATWFAKPQAAEEKRETLLTCLRLGTAEIDLRWRELGLVPGSHFSSEHIAALKVILLPIVGLYFACLLHLVELRACRVPLMVRLGNFRIIAELHVTNRCGFQIFAHIRRQRNDLKQ